MQDSNVKASETEKVTKEKGISGGTKKATLRWIEIVAFFVVFAFLLDILSYFLDPIKSKRPELFMHRDKNAASALTARPDSMDVLVIGDSEAMVMFSPQLLMDEAGISSFNSNQLGQRVAETYFLLKKILKKQNPKVIILETNVITHETTLHTEALLTTNALVQKQFPIIKFHGGWRFFLGFEKPDKIQSEKGFEDIAVVDPYTGGDYMFETEERADINPITIYYLDKIVALCKEKQIPLVFVSSPSPVNMDYPRHNALQDYADENNLDFIDFNLLLDEIGIDWSTDTGDKGDHINGNGSEKTTRYLMHYLKDNYDLPDHRED